MRGSKYNNVSNNIFVIISQIVSIFKIFNSILFTHLYKCDIINNRKDEGGNNMSINVECFFETYDQEQHGDNIIRLRNVVKEPMKLKKDGTPKKTGSHKMQGKSSEVYAFELDDAKRILEYFKYKEAWGHYLIFVFSCNLARRIVDILKFNWNDLINPVTGEIRPQVEIIEQKTKKNAKVHINSACREAIGVYIHETGIDPSENNYSNKVFVQIKGGYKGRVITDEGYRKALKNAAQNCGIQYNVGTHSGRKTAGKVLIETHPEDVRNISIIQSLLNHSNQNTTMRYIGKTKEMEVQYLEDLGEEFTKYVFGSETYDSSDNSPIVHLDINDLREIIKAAYAIGATNADNTDPCVHIDAVNQLMQLVDSKKK